MEEIKLRAVEVKKKQHQQSQQRYRDKIKAGLHTPKSETGRKRKIPDLPQRVEEIVNGEGVGAAHERRRTKDVVGNMGITELHKKVNENLEANNLPKVSVSTIRRACIPSRKDSHAAKKHYKDATVKLGKPIEDLSMDHVDLHYSMAAIKLVRCLAASLGEEAVCLSVDKKANIPLTGNIVKKSTRVAMLGTKKIRLHDHSFFVPHRATIGPNVVLECKPLGLQFLAEIFKLAYFFSRDNKTQNITQTQTNNKTQ